MAEIKQKKVLIILLILCIFVAGGVFVFLRNASKTNDNIMLDQTGITEDVSESKVGEQFKSETETAESNEPAVVSSTVKVEEKAPAKSVEVKQLPPKSVDVKRSEPKPVKVKLDEASSIVSELSDAETERDDGTQTVETEAEPTTEVEQNNDANKEKNTADFGIKAEDLQPKPKMNCPPMSVGALLEVNMNTPESYALGTGFFWLMVLPDWVKVGRFQVGIKGLYSYNFKTVHTLTTSVLFRWNFYDFEKVRTVDSGFYIQGEGGALFAWNIAPKPAKMYIFPVGQLTFGYRFSVKRFFTEPYIYAGYPTLWGAGISFGFRLGTE